MASGSIVLGSYYAHEPGGSPSWLFRVRTDRTASGWAVVKVWCVPVLKAKQRGLGMCSPPKVYAQVKLLLAQQKVREGQGRVRVRYSVQGCCPATSHIPHTSVTQQPPVS